MKLFDPKPWLSPAFYPQGFISEDYGHVIHIDFRYGSTVNKIAFVNNLTVDDGNTLFGSV